MEEWMDYVIEAHNYDRDFCGLLGLDYYGLLKDGHLGLIDAACVLPDFDF